MAKTTWASAGSFAKGRPRVSTAVKVAAGLAFLAGVSNTYADYNSSFETGSLAGFSVPSYASIVSLPIDGGGLNSVNQGKWLSVNSLAGKNVDETVTLSLSNLTAGQQYKVSFNLLIGASWDGSANNYGPDIWSLTANSGTAAPQTLVNATFSDYNGSNFGAGDSYQTYSIGTPTAGAGPGQFLGGTGAIASLKSGNYGADYSIYSFSQGASGPALSFTASDNTATLVFRRAATVSTDSPDEYWAINSLHVVAAVPEPETYAMLLAGLGVLGAIMRCRRTKA